jgi:hypothetical protein
MRGLNTVLAVALLSGAGLATASAAVPTACDTDGDRYISEQEARTCTEQRFEEISAGQEDLTKEHYGKAFPEAGDPEQLFTEADQDGDGKVTREEWMNWHEEGFTDATKASQGMMPTAEYESMVQGYVRPSTPDEPAQNKQ